MIDYGDWNEKGNGGGKEKEEKKKKKKEEEEEVKKEERKKKKRMKGNGKGLKGGYCKWCCNEWMDG